MTDKTTPAVAPATDEKIEQVRRPRRRRREAGMEPAQPKWLSDPSIMAVVGRLVTLEERLVELLAEREQQREQIAGQDTRIKRLEERISNMSRPDRLMTEKEVATLIGVSNHSLSRWRKERPARIPFVLFEGGDIRYRVEAIESYLQSRERGAKKGSAK